MDNNNIETYVREKLKPKGFSDEALNYIIDYMIQIEKLNLLPEDVTIVNLVDRLYDGDLKNIVFFDEEHPINDEFGHYFRGYTACSPREDAGTLYIRKSLQDSEIVFYHELTHQLQKNKDNLTQGVSYVDEEEHIRLCCLADEVQVQTVADMIYASKYGKELSTVKYKSENLRMLPRFRY